MALKALTGWSRRGGALTAAEGETNLIAHRVISAPTLSEFTDRYKQNGQRVRPSGSWVTGRGSDAISLTFQPRFTPRKISVTGCVGPRVIVQRGGLGAPSPTVAVSQLAKSYSAV
jgi:hypothetical protein